MFCKLNKAHNILFLAPCVSSLLVLLLLRLLEVPQLTLFLEEGYVLHTFWILLHKIMASGYYLLFVFCRIHKFVPKKAGFLMLNKVSFLNFYCFPSGPPHPFDEWLKMSHWKCCFRSLTVKWDNLFCLMLYECCLQGHHISVISFIEWAYLIGILLHCQGDIPWYCLFYTNLFKTFIAYDKTFLVRFCWYHREEHIQRDQGLMVLGQRNHWSLITHTLCKT